MAKADSQVDVKNAIGISLHGLSTPLAECQMAFLLTVGPPDR